MRKNKRPQQVGPTHPRLRSSVHSLPFYSFPPRLRASLRRPTSILAAKSLSRSVPDGLCGLYERKLKEINPAMWNITYDISDLYNFMDGLTDLSALVYDPSIHAYLPNDRQWVKQKMFQHLKRLASQSA